MKSFELREINEWKGQLESRARSKPMATSGGGAHSTNETRELDRHAFLLGLLIGERTKMESALKIYAEAVKLECVCEDEHNADCRHCRLVEKAHLEYPVT